jgi:AraC family transcriptional regulator
MPDPTAITAPPLAPKQFLGDVRAPLCANGLVLSQLVHQNSRKLPMHGHRTAYFELILDGYYDEGTRTRRFLFSPFTAAFSPSGMEHDGAILSAGARFFAIELENPAWLDPFASSPLMRQTVAELHGGPLLWLTLRLYREYLEGENFAALTTESLVWEMLGAAAGLHEDKHGLPLWWSRVRDLIHTRFREPISLPEVATEAGVHPVHVARVCRRVMGKTLGEWTQMLRVQFACQLLTQHDLNISTIAAEAGFSDQSHLTRMMRRYAHTTPARLRKVLAEGKRKSALAA